MPGGNDALRVQLRILCKIGQIVHNGLIEKSGFHHYVPKPYDFDALLRLVHSIERKTAVHA